MCSFSFVLGGGGSFLLRFSCLSQNNHPLPIPSLSSPNPVSHLPSPSFPSPSSLHITFVPVHTSSLSLSLSLIRLPLSFHSTLSTSTLSILVLFDILPVCNLPFPTSTHPPCLRINNTHTYAHPRHLHPPRIKQHTCTNTRSRTLKNGVIK
ncbi:hypothetical protein BKA57DRAFT_114473 [Linnemannia elongata]|nr:hypothetical protein BKA57DRAFT_114473 [Linnemannia elongata]